MGMEKIDGLLDMWRDEMIGRLKAWISAPSVQGAAEEGAPFGKEVRKMLNLFLKDAADMGFETDDAEGYAGSAQMGHGERTMGILTHLDVVPAGDGWTYPPFEGTVAEGKIYGRGVLDDKGPALAALYAMRAVREAGIPLKDGVRLIAGCDEETGMSDMAYYAQTRKMPDYGFSPDAEYPLINIEKGRVALRLTGGVEKAGEITLVSANAGVRVNVVPGIAEAVVHLGNVPFDELETRLADTAKKRGLRLTAEKRSDGEVRITALGIQSHAAMPENGLNAAGALLMALDDLGVGGTAVQGLARNLGTDYTGKGVNVDFRDELSGPLTLNIGLLRCDGKSLSAGIDIRYPLCAKEEEIIGNMSAAFAPWGTSVTRIEGHTPLHVPAEHPLVKTLLRVYEDKTGLKGKPLAIGGGTYSRMMPNTVAFGVCFPGDTDTCHMPDEYMEVDKLLLSAKIMAHAVARLAGEA